MFKTSEAQLQIVIRAKDEASKTIKGLTDTIMKNHKAIGIGMTAMGGAVFGGLAMATKAFMKQEKAETRLTHLVKQTTGATDEQIEVLKEQAKALQKVGVVGDEVTMVGQSQLATFALTTEQIEMLTPSLLDMVVATKGVNATQEDMINTGNALGRAIDGGAGALTRYGISLTDTQKELYTTATREERVVMLTNILEDNFGGLNEATRETSEGGMKAIKNDMGDLLEQVGKQVIPIIEQLVEAIKPIIEKMMAWIKENPELFATITKVVAVIGGLLLVLGPLMIILPGLITFFTLLTGPIGLVIGIIGALILIVIAVKKNWEPIKAFFSKLWEGIKNVFKIAWEFIKMIFFNATIPGLIIKNWEKIKTFFRNVWEGIKDIFRSAIDWLMEKIQPFIDAFEVVKKGAGWIGEKAGGAVSGVKNWAKGLLGFAEGGVVPGVGAQLAVVHGGETIIPRNKSVGGDVNIYIQGGNYLDREAGEKFADIIGKMLREQLRYQQ